MRSDCIQAVTTAAAKTGKTLTQGELAGIEGRIKQALRDTAREDVDAFRQLTPAEQLSKAADRVAKDLVAEKQRKALNTARQVVKYDQAQKFVDALAAKGMRRTEAINRMLVNYLDNKSGFRTLESAIEGVVRGAKGNMEGFAQVTSRYAGFWTNKAMVADVIRELHGESTGNAKARWMADKWTETAENLRKQFNELGGNIRKLKGWAVPQDHSALKVARASTNDWIDYVLPRLNREVYVNERGDFLTDNEMRALLGEAKLSIATDGAWKEGTTPGSSAIRNRGQERRVLHFKDAQSWMEYQNLYGERSLLEAMNGHIEGMGRAIGALQTFGPQAEAGLSALLDDAVRKDTAAGMDKDEARKQRAKAEIAFDYASGKMGQMGDPRVAHKFQVARSWLSAARLGSASLSALTDSANILAVANSWNMPEFRAWAKWESKAWSSASFRAMMRSNGVGVEAIAHSMSRYGEEVFGHGWANNLANTIFRVSGLNFIDNVRRTATGAMLFDRIGQLAREHETLAAAHPDDVARLRDAAVSDQTWGIWRQAALAAGDDALLSPATIKQLSGVSEATKRDAIESLIGVVSKEVDTVVPMPTLKARASIEYAGIGKRGTVPGEISRSILQFKSFPLAMISNHWQRLQSLPTPGGKALYAAELIATSTILGAVSIQLKSMVAGNNPQDMTDPKFTARAFLQGGATGLYGDVLLGLYASPYKERLTDQMGPLSGSIADLYDLGRAALDKAHGESRANPAGDAVRFIRGNTPGANLWYLKAAFDHLIFQRLQDYYAPGYASRQQQNAQKAYNTSQFWPASTAARIAPIQAPNLKTAIGER